MITTLYAGLLGLMFLALTYYVILGRFKYGIALGDGGNQQFAQRVRLHGNFAEFVPLALVLMFLAEYEGSSPVVLHALGIALVAARVAHVIGLGRAPGLSMGRLVGLVLTTAVILAASVLCLWGSISGGF